MSDLLGSLVWDSQKWIILCVIRVGCYKNKKQKTRPTRAERETEKRERERESTEKWGRKMMDLGKK